MKLKTLLTPALLAAGLMALPFGAQAAVFAPFASFSNGFFTFTNVPGPGIAGATFVTQVSSPQPANFVFNENVSYLGTTYLAGQAINNVTVTLSATDRGTATSTPIPGTGLTFLNQPIQDNSLIPGSVALKFTDSHGYNLLTVSNFTANLSGFSGFGVANLSSDTQATPPSSLFYSSNFLTFLPNNQGSDSIGLTLTNGSTLTYNAGDGFLNSFTAVGDGTFTAIAVAPEPSGMVSLSVLGGCLALVAVRRKKITA